MRHYSGFPHEPSQDAIQNGGNPCAIYLQLSYVSSKTFFPAFIQPPGVKREEEDGAGQEQEEKIGGEVREAAQIGEEVLFFFRCPRAAVAYFHQERNQGAHLGQFTQRVPESATLVEPELPPPGRARFVGGS